MKISIFLLAAAIVLAPIIWHFSARMSQPGGPDRRLAGEHEDRIAYLEAEVEVLRNRIEHLEAAERTPGLSEPDTGALLPVDTVSRFGGFDELMLLSAPNDSNAGLTSLLLDDLQEIFGLPALRLSQKCASPSSEHLLALLETRDVGPFQAQLLRPALDSLGRVLANVNENYPNLYRQLRNYGGFCARLVRGSDISVSRHSFGVAIDISIGGTLDAMGDGKTQFGLIILHELFYEEDWVWGAGFGREDSMHFEVSAELFQRWRDAGLL